MQKMIYIDPEEGKVKMHLEKIDRKRGVLHRVENAKFYSICDQCSKREECLDRKIADSLGYLIVQCDYKP